MTKYYNSWFHVQFKKTLWFDYLLTRYEANFKTFCWCLWVAVCISWAGLPCPTGRRNVAILINTCALWDALRIPPLIAPLWWIDMKHRAHQWLLNEVRLSYHLDNAQKNAGDACKVGCVQRLEFFHQRFCFAHPECSWTVNNVWIGCDLFRRVCWKCMNVILNSLLPLIVYAALRHM